MMKPLKQFHIPFMSIGKLSTCLNPKLDIYRAFLEHSKHFTYCLINVFNSPTGQGFPLFLLIWPRGQIQPETIFYLADSNLKYLSFLLIVYHFSV